MEYMNIVVRFHKEVFKLEEQEQVKQNHFMQ